MAKLHQFRTVGQKILFVGTGQIYTVKDSHQPYGIPTVELVEDGLLIQKDSWDDEVGPDIELVLEPYVMTKKELEKLYGMNEKYAIFVMPERIKNAPRQKGERQKYLVSRELPSVYAYKELMRKKYTRTASDLAEEAHGELDSVKEELQDWFDNLPEHFQSGDKGEQLQTAIDALEQATEFDQAYGDLGELPVYHPPLYIRPESRADRRDMAVAALEAVMDAFKSHKEHLETWTVEDVLESALETKCPGCASTDVLEGRFNHGPGCTWTPQQEMESCEENISNLECFMTDLDDAISAAQDVEFPRMMG